VSLACAAALSGCRGHENTSAPAQGATAVPVVPGETPAHAEPSGTHGPTPAVRVQGTADARTQGVAISVQNHAAQVVQLAGELALERQEGGAFRAFPQPGLALRTTAGCVQLAPGAELRPEPWPSAKAGAPPGTYRFVVRGCDGSYRIEGDPFEL
jgi:hypothetical protein